MGKREYIIFLGLIFELVTLVIVLVYAGHYIDGKYETKGFATMSGAALALLIWVIHLILAFQPKDGPKE